MRIVLSGKIATVRVVSIVEIESCWYTGEGIKSSQFLFLKIIQVKSKKDVILKCIYRCAAIGNENVLRLFKYNWIADIFNTQYITYNLYIFKKLF